MIATKQLSENKMAVFNILSTIIIAGINFFTIPVFTRLLDTSGYGLVNVYTAWVQIATILVGLKIDGTVGSASSNLSPEDQGPYQLSIAVFALFTFGVLFCLVLLLIKPLSDLLEMNSLLVICMMLQSIGALIVLLFSMRFIFRKEAHLNFLLSVGICLSTTVLSIVLVCFVFPGPDAYFGRVIGLAIPNFFIGIILFFYLFSRYRNSFSFSYWKFCLPLSIPLIFHALSQVVLAQTGRIVIQHVFDDSMAGIYSIAVVIVMLLNSIYTALNNAFVPFMYDDLSGKTSEIIKQRHFNNYFLEFTLGTMAFAMMAPEILKLMSTEAYWGSLIVLPLLTIGQYCVFLYSFSVNYELYKMKTRTIAVGTIAAAFLNLILSLFLIPLWGMLGAAFATLIAYFFLFLFHLCIARFLLGDKNYATWKLFVGLLAVVCAAILYYPLATFVVVRWGIGSAIMLGVVSKIIHSQKIF